MKLDPTLKASLCLGLLAAAPFVALAYGAGTQAAATAKKIEPEGFRWRGLAKPAEITKIVTVPSSSCTVYRVDTEGHVLYVAQGGSNVCSITSSQPVDQDD